MPALTELLLDERLDELAELRFDDDQALALAQATDVRGFLVPIHDIRKAISRGCTREQALAMWT